MDVDEARWEKEWDQAYKTKLENERKEHDDEHWRIEMQGKRFTVRCKRYRQAISNTTRRGQITHFSRRARAARLRRIAEVDWKQAGRGVMVTLTYPDAQSDHTMNERKNHRYLINRSICQWAKRQLGCFWRVEWMPRLSGECIGQLRPHMHLLYLSIQAIEEERVRTRWKEIIGAKQYVQVDCRELSVGDMVACYVSKYCSKEASQSYLDNVPKRNRSGRHAGELRKALIPTHPQEVVRTIDQGIVKMLRGRACETLWWYDERFDEGFTVLGDVALEMIKEINDIKVDGSGRIT